DPPIPLGSSPRRPRPASGFDRRGPSASPSPPSRAPPGGGRFRPPQADLLRGRLRSLFQKLTACLSEDIFVPQQDFAEGEDAPWDHWRPPITKSVKPSAPSRSAGWPGSLSRDA